MTQLPKIELHCHLDGSLRPQTVLELANEYNIDTQTSSLAELSEKLIAPKACDSLLTYLTRFDLPIAVMQTREALYRVTYELMEDAANENVKYIEIRYAPQQHLNKGLSLEDTIEAVLKGIEDASNDFEIKGNLILSYLRHTDAKGMVELIEAGKSFLGRGVVAVDLCAGEEAHFSQKFVEPVAHARKLGYRVTIHAGETGIGDNVIEAIELLKADRIGHGVAISEHAEAFKSVLNHDVTLECCPTSNIQTKAVSTMEQHPIDMFRNKGVKVTVNTDNRTVSDVTMTQEYEKLNAAFGWEDDLFNEVFLQGIQSSYADVATKVWLQSFLK